MLNANRTTTLPKLYKNELSPDYLLRTFHLFPYLVFVAVEMVAVVVVEIAGAFFAAVGFEVLAVVDVEALSAVADSNQKCFQVNLA